MTRSRARIAGALAVPLVLTACGSVSSAASDLEEDAARANAALAGAKGIGVVVRFDDPDGDLEQALQDGPDGMPADLAEVVAGSRLELRLAATDGRTLGDSPDPGLPLAEQLRWVDSAFAVSTTEADLLSWRSVDGVLYVSSDLSEVERVAAAAGSPVSLRDELAAAPPPLLQVHDALRDGKALRVPLEDLLGVLEGQEDPTAQGLPEDLLEDLRAAIEPHARLTDLGSDDGVRRVTVEVDVKQLLEAVLRTAAGGTPGAADLDELSDASVTGTLTIEDGHYRRLELPLGELTDLVADPTVDVPDLGDSALVVELDDTVEQVQAPSRVADVDVAELLESSFPQPGGPGASPADQALISCLEQAQTDEQLAACSATA